MEYKRNKKWKLIKWKIKKRMNERYRNEYIYIYIYKFNWYFFSLDDENRN